MQQSYKIDGTLLVGEGAAAMAGKLGESAIGASAAWVGGPRSPGGLVQGCYQLGLEGRRGAEDGRGGGAGGMMGELRLLVMAGGG